MPRGIVKNILESAPGGIRRDVNPATIPAGQWLDSKNWIVRRGVGRPRPGYDNLSFVDPLAAGDEVIGFAFGLPPAITGYSTFVVHTATAAYEAISGTVLTGTWNATVDFSNKVRMATFFSTSQKIVRVNFVNAVDQWDMNLANDFVDCTGAPTAHDLTVIEPYLIVGGTGTNADAVRWCAANDLNSWPAVNQLNMREEPGTIFAVRALNSRSFAAYKLTGLWICTLQAAKVAFQKTFIGRIRGPANPSLLVERDGVHYWMGDDFVIYAFDGQSVKVVTREIAAKFAESLSQAQFRYGCAAITSGDEPEIWFFFPGLTAFTIAISYNLKNGSTCYHELADAIFTAIDAWMTTGTPSATFTPRLFIGNDAGQIFDFSDFIDDNGTDIPWHFEFGWRPLATIQEEGEVDSITSYWKKTSGDCEVTASITLSNSIGDDETTQTGTFNTSEPLSTHRVTIPDLRAKWAKIKFSAPNVVPNLEFRGANVMGWKRTQDE